MKRTVEETPRLQGAGGGGAGGSGCTWVTQSALKGPGCKTGGPGRRVQSSLSQWQGADHFNLESIPPAPRREWSHVGISASGDSALSEYWESHVTGAGGRAGWQGTPAPSSAPAHVHPVPQPLACIVPVCRGQAAVSLYCGVWFAAAPPPAPSGASWAVPAKASPLPWTWWPGVLGTVATVELRGCLGAAGEGGSGS